MFHKARPWICAATAIGAPCAVLWLGYGEGIAFGLAGLALILCGEASPWLVVLAALPLFQLLAGEPPRELADAMAAAGVVGPGAIAADPAALYGGLSAFAGCLAVFALARTAARRSSSAVWWAAAGVAAFGCFEGAVGVASGVGAAPASGTLVHRGQYAALLELSLGAGCGLAAAAWAGRSWRERLEDKALLGAALGLSAAALSLAGIAASLSRTGIVAGGLAAVAAAAWFGRKNLWALGAVAVVVAGLAWGAPRAIDRFEQLAAAGGDPGRSAIWADSLDLTQRNWLTGAGLGSFPTTFRRSSFYLPRKSIDNAHNDHLESAFEIGAPATALLLGSLVAVLLGAARRARTSPLAAGCLLGAVAILLHAAVDLPLQLPALAALMAGMLGLASASQSRNEPVAQPATVAGSRVVATEEPSRRLVTLQAGQLAPRRLMAAARGAGRLPAAAVGVLALVLPLVPVETPQALYIAAGEASAAGDRSQAERLYIEALDRNVHAAPAWLRLAELARGRGDDDRALLFSRAAQWVEPYTLRTEWPLAELELELGQTAPATRRLAGLLTAAPDLLDAALHTATRSGLSPGELRALVPENDPEAAGRYLAFLVRSDASDQLHEAYARLGAPQLPQHYRDWLFREADFRP